MLKVVCPGWGWIRHHAESRETMGDLLGRHGVLCGDSGARALDAHVQCSPDLLEFYWNFRLHLFQCVQGLYLQMHMGLSIL